MVPILEPAAEPIAHWQNSKGRVSIMYILDLIEKKKKHQSLTVEEINFFVNGVVNNSFKDYQVSAFLMAVWFQGMDRQETTALTLAMAHSGDIINLSTTSGIKVDKHSTGGVADTTTLIAGPLTAACGGRVAKMSGRGLGFTGGTLDKLESIPGFNISVSMENFTSYVEKTGLAVIGQTANLVPADKKLYELRDVTATIDSLPLIASSIMSKKLASGSDAIVLDVKTGSGAFMKAEKDAQKLARIMVDIGKDAGKNTRAIVTSMDQPLGNAVGNALEVQEAIEILSGSFTGDLLDVSKALAVQMLITSEICSAESEAEKKIDDALSSGKALESLKQMILNQGGNPDIINNINLLPQAERTITIYPEKNGYLQQIDASLIGKTALLLGAGRLTKDEDVDPAVGIWMKARLGDKVDRGVPIAIFHVNDEKNLQEAMEVFNSSISIGDRFTEKPALIHGTPII